MALSIDRLQTIVIGRMLDGGVEEIEIDCRSWQVRYPELTDYRVEVTNPDGIVYPPERVEMKDGRLIWTIMPSDTAIEGEGMYQIVATGENGERKTSMPCATIIKGIMPGTAGEEPPEAAQPWVEKVMGAAERAENAAVHAPVIGENGNWLVFDFEAGKYRDSGVKAQGEDGKTPVKGEDYFDGAPGYTPKKGVDYFDGKDGKTAYQYAVEGGYTGTEAEFAAKLAEEIPEPYTLPAATADRLGGVMIGEGLTADEDGRVSVNDRVTLEVIAEITVNDEGVRKLRIDEDAGGKPFRLVSASIDVYIPQAAANSNVWLTWIGDGEATIAGSALGALSANAARVLRSWADRINGIWHSFAGNSSNDTNSPALYGEHVRNSGNYTSNAIVAVTFTLTADIPAGTTFTLKGVRAK